MWLSWQEGKAMKTIYCPACGELCRATQDPIDSEGVLARCSKGHGWAVSISMDAPESVDGTTVISFQCDGTSAYELPEVIA
jgi:hypothetical protein